MKTDATTVAKRFPIGLTLATAVALSILIGLGVWQVKRLAWKEALLARVAALQSAPAKPLQPLLEHLPTGPESDFIRVSVDCPGLGAAPFLELYSVREAGAGSRLISACRVAGGPYRSVLVDRGFVGDQVSARPPVDAADVTPMHLVGVLRSPDRPSFVTPKNDVAANRWYWRDVPAMAKVLGVSAPAPLMLMAETSTNPEWKALNPTPLPAEISNRHLEYALTWFGLAAALACVYAASLWKWWKS
ncbi:MAG TPA: SURF1 family cytochrome oxidase biogenesis protein [Phenylobacterium sp.]|nr:SURF1 family cytochrome oxidase biogenesis protein [Phenylobacterium sp.]